MKLKKIKKILPEYEVIKVWGRDENVPLYHGYVTDLPRWLFNFKLTKGMEGAYIEPRFRCSDCDDHLAVFVDE